MDGVLWFLTGGLVGQATALLVVMLRRLWVMPNPPREVDEGFTWRDPARRGGG